MSSVFNVLRFIKTFILQTNAVDILHIFRYFQKFSNASLMIQFTELKYEQVLLHFPCKLHSSPKSCIE